MKMNQRRRCLRMRLVRHGGEDGCSFVLFSLCFLLFAALYGMYSPRSYLIYRSVRRLAITHYIAQSLYNEVMTKERRYGILSVLMVFTMLTMQ